MLGGVLGVRLVVVVVPHLFTVAVISGNEPLTIMVEQCSLDPAYALIQYLHCGYGSVELPCVPDHVAVGEIHHNKVIQTCGDGIDQRIGHLAGAHLWLQVIGCDVW